MMGRELFDLGTICATPGAIELLQDLDPERDWFEGAAPYLWRHVCGCWEEMNAHDRRENRLAVKHRYRVLSAYATSEGRKLWIITEADRSVTTILTPEEY